MKNDENIITIKASRLIDGKMKTVSKTVKIVKLKKGDTGDSGNSAYSVILSNEALIDFPN